MGMKLAFGMATAAALVSGCKRGPDCGELKIQAKAKVDAARATLSTVPPREKWQLDEATEAVAELGTFGAKLNDGIAELAPQGCAPALICCTKVPQWIADNESALASDRPIWRLPEFGTSKAQPKELTADLATYDKGVQVLATELAKGKAADAKAATAACTQSNEAITRVQAAAPASLAAAHKKLDGDLAAIQDKAIARSNAIDALARWSDATVSGAHVDLGEPRPDEPAELTTARAAMRQIADCK